MKPKLILLVFAVTLFSCNKDKKHLQMAQEKADNFIEFHANSFLTNNELLAYDYHPRAQFSHTQDSTNNYRIWVRENELRLTCYSDCCNLTEAFLYSELNLENGNYIITPDSIKYYEGNFRMKEFAYNFKSNPIEYFHNLKKQLNEYGAFAFHQSKDKSFTRVYLTTQYYLIQTNEPKELPLNRIIKKYDNNWYFIELEKPMDLG